MSAGTRGGKAVSMFRNFKPPGPVAAAFLADRQHDVRLIRGPFASGKTVVSIFDHLSNATAMPVCRDGWIHFRLAACGITYGQLERNLYPTWHYWLSKDGGDWTEGEWEGGGGRFAKQTLEFDILRGDRVYPVRFETIFGAIGEMAIESFTRGFEPTAWYLFEVDQFPDGIIEACLGRRSRFPNADMLGRQPDYRSYVVGDLNSPDIDSWYYKTVEETKPEGWKQYVQPSGLSPNAENVHNLAPNYYADLYRKNKHKKRWVKRFIMNEYGPSDAGEAVYGDDYADEFHLAPDGIPYDPQRPIYLGFDQDLNGAAVVAQKGSNNRWKILAEYVPGRVGPRRFAQGLRELLDHRCPGWRVAGAWADRAGFGGADREGGELAWAEIVAAELGIIIEPGPTQQIAARHQAVRDQLTFAIEPGIYGIVLSGPDCPMLRKGFNSHYMFEKRKPEQGQASKPIKNVWSNPHDALQYLLTGYHGYGDIIGGPRAEQRRMADNASSDGVTVVRSSFMGRW